MRTVVRTGSERKRGGDPSVKETGAWCKSVRSQPALIGYNEVIPLSELVKGDDIGKYALFMAILDKWYCNGGRAYDFDLDKATVKCICPTDFQKDYTLDNRCLPKSPKCYDSADRLVPCFFGKIMVGFAWSYSRVVRIDYAHRLTLSVQRPDQGYAIMGSLGLKDSTYAGGQTAVVSLRTPDSLVTQALSFQPVWAGVLMYASFKFTAFAVYRPVCPAGYNSISDFVRPGGDAPPKGIYKDYEIRPCIIESCLRTCGVRWLWDTSNNVARTSALFITIAGGNAKYGSATGNAGAFFRAVDFKYYPHYNIPISLTQCLDPKCIVEE